MATYWENSCSFGLRYVSRYKYLIVSLVFSHLGFWSGNLFLIAPFPDLCLLYVKCIIYICTSQSSRGSGVGPTAACFMYTRLCLAFSLVKDFKVYDFLFDVFHCPLARTSCINSGIHACVYNENNVHKSFEMGPREKKNLLVLGRAGDCYRN